jgi:hypothetical protein
LEDFLMPATRPFTDRASSVSRRSFLRLATGAAVAVPIVTEAHLAWHTRTERSPLQTA